MRTGLATIIAVVAVTYTPMAQHRHSEPQAETDGHQPHMEHRFDDPERYARSFDDPARDEWQMPERVIEALSVRPGQLVADVGAGTGYFTMRLAELTAAARVYAVDIEPSMTDWVRQRADDEGIDNVIGVLAASDRTNLPEPVDLVLVVDTYHHIPDRVAYFRRLGGELRPDGRIAIIDFRKDSPSGPPVEFRFTPAQIVEELGEAGLTLQAEYDFLPRQMFLVFGVS